MEDRFDRNLQHLLGTMDSEEEAVLGERYLPDPPPPITEMGEVLSVLGRLEQSLPQGRLHQDSG